VQKVANNTGTRDVCLLNVCVTAEDSRAEKHNTLRSLNEAENVLQHEQKDKCRFQTDLGFINEGQSPWWQKKFSALNQGRWGNTKIFRSRGREREVVQKKKSFDQDFVEVGLGEKQGGTHAGKRPCGSKEKNTQNLCTGCGSGFEEGGIRGSRSWSGSKRRKGPEKMGAKKIKGKGLAQIWVPRTE